MRTCFICGRNGCADPLDKHHVFGGAYRKKSEHYGLVVDLCHNDCHIFGKDAAHNNAETMERLHKWGQKKVMLEQGWTAAEFISVFGKNHLDVAELEETYKAQRAVPTPGSFRITEETEDFISELWQ